MSTQKIFVKCEKIAVIIDIFEPLKTVSQIIFSIHMHKLQPRICFLGISQIPEKQFNMDNVSVWDKYFFAIKISISNIPASNPDCVYFQWYVGRNNISLPQNPLCPNEDYNGIII